MHLSGIFASIGAGLFWGTIVAGIYKWFGRKSPNGNMGAFKIFAVTALIMAMGFYALHGDQY